MLSADEQDKLYMLITSIIGEDQTIKNHKPIFNEATIEVVEDMVEANIQCNTNMRQLITELVGGASNMTKGWLKKLLKTTKKSLSRIQLHGYGCLAATKARWKSAILVSTI